MIKLLLMQSKCSLPMVQCPVIIYQRKLICQSESALGSGGQAAALAWGDATPVPLSSQSYPGGTQEEAAEMTMTIDPRVLQLARMYQFTS
jgi:hypothetical protein